MDFSPFLLPGNSSVSIPYLGSYGKDFLLCDIIRGIPRGPLQTWHHHEVVGLMYCLPAPDHRIPHTGGVFHYEIATGIADYPLW